MYVSYTKRVHVTPKVCMLHQIYVCNIKRMYVISNVYILYEYQMHVCYTKCMCVTSNVCMYVCMYAYQMYLCYTKCKRVISNACMQKLY